MVLEAQAQAVLVQLDGFPQRTQLSLPQRLLVRQGCAYTLAYQEPFTCADGYTVLKSNGIVP